MANDDEKRKEAHTNYYFIRNRARYGVTANNINDFEETLKKFTGLLKKEPDDIHIMSEICDEMAIWHFNRANNLDAAKWYSQSANYLNQLEKSDKVMRLLVLRYIDLADAAYESGIQFAGDCAIANAITAFNLIHVKDNKEKEIGDPVKNFRMFHKYHESKTSTDSYIASIKFQNHQRAFESGVFAKEAEKLGEILASTQVNAPQNDEDIELEKMFSTLSVSQFIAININEPPGDMQYQQFAGVYIRMIMMFLRQKNLTNARKTAKDALELLEKIKSPAADIIEIKAKLTHFVGDQNQNAVQNYKELTQLNGFFRHIDDEDMMDTDEVANHSLSYIS